MSHQPMIPFAAAAAAATASAILPGLPAAAMEMPSGDLRDTDRRLSTGMVGLPSDIHAMELTYALRGVSMPMLENFVLDQPLRKPRPPSPPELSPRQLPSTVSPPMFNVQNSHHSPQIPGFSKLSAPPGVYSSPIHTTRQVEKPVITPDPIKCGLDTDQANTSRTPINVTSHATPTAPSHSEGVGSKSTLVPPLRPSPYSESSHHTPRWGSSPRPPENHHRHISSTQKQPCQICSRLRHQAQFPGTQGLPMVKAALPPHLTPQLHCHPSYGQHIHPQIIAMPTSNMHQFGSSFAPVMMPINRGPFVPLPSHQQPQSLPHKVTPQQQEKTERDKRSSSKRARGTQSPETNHSEITATNTTATSSPIKPPASLIQPTYRKRSPNLIVDVAETCQERFPFEEVARRHKVPINKVFDVFAAIIQVPLLRCPTDRRRPGRLATARIKEYNRAKKDIQGSRPNEREGNGQEATVGSTDIAQKLGQVELPQGFTLDEQ
ncbi:hypothetical protein O1611_g2297 [Lasiodiplodia mahajangana]|uniref:Uncharacterized protein n=1 Tax=Lasiodiplodia mahajangana TaxID=1108764 RepID=A0ACC2JV09_9PEZI|nr:hypothetical protein O1611_g2297 [Lasiodiplodia mahajangana]